MRRTSLRTPWAALIALLVPTLGHAAVATQLTAGPNHACALNGAGGVECWGLNSRGEVGNGTTLRANSPVGVVGLGSGVASVTAGLLHTCVVTTGGALKCWGANQGFQLGDGTMIDRSTPIDVTGLASDVASVAGGSAHTCVLMTDATVKCWGTNLFGQLGDGTNTDRPTPTDVPGLTGIAALAAGQSHTCALTTGGGVKCWGFNTRGQLGNGTTVASTTPVDVSGLASGVTALAAGQFHTCALTAVGGVKCWGANGDGDLGDGTTIDRSSPVDAVGLTSGVVGLDGTSALCALTAAGRATCWGDGETVPTEVPYFSDMTAILRSQLTLNGITASGEIRSSRGGGFTSGYGPFGSIHWPFGCAFGYGDGDGDGVCDSADPCNTLHAGQSFPKPNLVVRRINTETVPGNDTLTLNAQFALPPALSFGDLDPLAQGSRLVFLHPLGVTTELTFPPGAYAGLGSSGWKITGSGRPRWEFVDATGAPTGRRVIERLKVQDQSRGVPGGTLQISLTVKAGNLPITSTDLPLQIALVVGDGAAAAAGACGEGRFQRACEFNGNGSTLACKPSVFSSYIFF